MSDKNIIINYVTLLNAYYNNRDKIRFWKDWGITEKTIQQQMKLYNYYLHVALTMN